MSEKLLLEDLVLCYQNANNYSEANKGSFQIM